MAIASLNFSLTNHFLCLTSSLELLLQLKVQTPRIQQRVVSTSFHALNPPVQNESHLLGERKGLSKGKESSV